MNWRPRGLRVLTPLLLVLFLLCGTSWAQQSPPRNVDLKASDGTILKASYFAAAKPGPGVLLLHQCNRQRKVWDDLAESLAAAGVNVLTLDFRGFGESGGTPLDKLSQQEVIQTIDKTWPGDVDTALRYLESQPGVQRNLIGAGGASCGVNQSVQLARRHDEVKSLVLLSEGTDLKGREFLRRSPKLPIFLAVADDDPDRGVVQIMQWLYSLSSNPASQFVRYPAGGHGVEMFAAHKELPGMIVEWFRTSLENPSRKLAAPAASRATAETRFLDLTDQPGGISKAAEMYAEARRENPQARLFTEAVVNRIGYEHLQTGDTKGAIEILKLNVIAYPNSPNVYDSLSDAYLADGQKDLARQNAKKALELLPSDTTDPAEMREGIKASAEQKLKQLGDAPQ